MNKIIRRIAKIVVVIICIYIIYVGFDCIRLRNSPKGTKPIITISGEATEMRVIYKGLGYSITYYINSIEESTDDDTKLVEVNGYGAEFKMFNKILIWAWVE